MVQIERIRDEYGKETAVLLLALRVYFGTAKTADLAGFCEAESPDWDRVRQLCRLHRVRPIVYPALLHLTLSPQVKKQLTAEMLHIMALCGRSLQETLRIILLLREHGVLALPYKGAVLARQIFGNVNARESGDIDLVIRREDLANVIGVLEQDGYLSENKKVYEFLNERIFSYSKDYNLNKYVNGERLHHVELHWNIADDFLNVPEGSTDLLYQHTTELQLLNKPITVIGHTDHILAAVIHHCRKDVLRNLKLLVDLVEALKEGAPVDRDLAYRTFTAFRLEKSIGTLAELAKRLLGVTVPVARPVLLNETALHRITDQLCGKLHIDIIYLRKWNYIAAQLALRDTGADKMAFLLKFASFSVRPSMVDFEVMQLPAPLFFLYPVLKPIRFLIRPTDYDGMKEKLARKSETNHR